MKKLEDEMRCFLYKMLLDVEPAGIVVIRSSNHLCVIKNLGKLTCLSHFLVGKNEVLLPF